MVDEKPNYVIYVMRGKEKKSFFFNERNDAVSKFNELDDKTTAVMYILVYD